MAPYTPFLRPRRFFAAHEVSFARVAAVFGILLMTGPLTVYGIGWVLAANVDGTVLVDNPARPPDAFCPEDGCEEPEQIERDVDTALWDVMDRFVGPSFVVYPLVLVGLTLLMHGGVWVVGGERGWFPTLAIVAWGLVPTLAVVALMIVGLNATLDPITVSPGDDLSVAFAPLEAQLRSFRPIGRVGSVLTAVWGGLIWRAGLLEHQGLPNTEATLLAGLVAVLNAVAAGLL